MANLVFETDRLELRQLSRDDVDHVLALYSDPEAMKFYPSTRGREEVVAWIERFLESYEKNGYGFWACVLKDTGEYVGHCGLVEQKDVAGQDELEIGYGILRKHWKKGYATEAAVGTRNYAFQELGLTRLISLIHPDNKASARVAEKVGMSLEKEVSRWEFPRILVYSIESTSL